MRRAHVVGLASIAVGAASAIAACFPDYDFSPAGGDGGAPDATVDGAGRDASGDSNASDGGSDAGSIDGASDAPFDAGPTGDSALPPFDAATMIAIDAGSFTFGGAGGTPATLTHAFYIDAVEASVGRFRAFVDAGSPLPCDGGACSLDVPGGPYAAQMKWDPSWNAHVGETDYATSCSGARDTTVNDPTFNDGHDEYPIGCVSWYQAVAMCAFEKKRLATETEWEYVASGRGLSRAYPWGNAPPVGCGEAIWRDGLDSGTKNGCHWPVAVGSARDGGSRDGVLDLTGSVYEWVWDEVGSYSGGSDPITPSNPGAGTRGDRGGSFGADDQYLVNQYRDETPTDGHYTDVGFRCARTVP